MRKLLAWFICWSGVMIASFIDKEGACEFVVELAHEIVDKENK